MCESGYMQVPGESLVKDPDGRILDKVEWDCFDCDRVMSPWRYVVSDGATCEEDSKLDSLTLKPGFWRGYQSSQLIRPCKHDEAKNMEDNFKTRKLDRGVVKYCDGSECVIPVCIGSDDALSGTNASENSSYCNLGHKGPLCSICTTDFYFDEVEQACLLCEGDNWVPFVAAFVFIFGLPLLIAVGYLYLQHRKSLKAKRGDETDSKTLSVVGRGVSFAVREFHKVAVEKRELEDNNEEDSKDTHSKCFHQIKRFLFRAATSYNKIKILISLYQLVDSTPFVLNIRFPERFTKLREWIGSFSNFQVIEILPLECVQSLSYQTSLIAQTIGPIGVLLLILGTTWAFACCRHEFNWKEANIWALGGWLALLWCYFVFPGTSVLLFYSLKCDDEFDPDGGISYMSADMSVRCTDESGKLTAEYSFIRTYTKVFIWVYPFGIPFMFAILLYCHRRALGLGAWDLSKCDLITINILKVDFKADESEEKLNQWFRITVADDRQSMTLWEVSEKDKQDDTRTDGHDPEGGANNGREQEDDEANELLYIPRVQESEASHVKHEFAAENSFSSGYPIRQGNNQQLASLRGNSEKSLSGAQQHDPPSETEPEVKDNEVSLKQVDGIQGKSEEAVVSLKKVDVIQEISEKHGILTIRLATKKKKDGKICLKPRRIHDAQRVLSMYYGLKGQENEQSREVSFKDSDGNEVRFEIDASKPTLDYHGADGVVMHAVTSVVETKGMIEIAASANVNEKETKKVTPQSWNDIERILALDRTVRLLDLEKKIGQLEEKVEKAEVLKWSFYDQRATLEVKLTNKPAVKLFSHMDEDEDSNVHKSVKTIREAFQERHEQELEQQTAKLGPRPDILLWERGALGHHVISSQRSNQPELNGENRSYTECVEILKCVEATGDLAGWRRWFANPAKVAPQWLPGPHKPRWRAKVVYDKDKWDNMVKKDLRSDSNEDEESEAVHLELEIEDTRPPYMKFLVFAYEPKWFFFEVFECIRRLMFSGILILIEDKPLLRIQVACVACLFSIKSYSLVRPYESDDDDVMAETAQWQLFSVFFCGLLVHLRSTVIDNDEGHFMDWFLYLMMFFGPGLAAFQLLKEMGAFNVSFKWTKDNLRQVLPWPQAQET